MWYLQQSLFPVVRVVEVTAPVGLSSGMGRGDDGDDCGGGVLGNCGAKRG